MILITISLLALVLLFALPALHAAGIATAEAARTGILIGTIGWFATAQFWIKRKS